MSGKKVVNRYSLAFKQKVVSQIEQGELSLAQAQKVYDITGGQTIQNWIKKLGKNHLLSKVVRIEMKGEQDKIKELEKQKQQLESALAQAHLKIITLESTLECVEEHYNVDVKKNFGTQVQNDLSSKQKNNQ
jgi:transposase-like protein